MRHPSRGAKAPELPYGARLYVHLTSLRRPTCQEILRFSFPRRKSWLGVVTRPARVTRLHHQNCALYDRPSHCALVPQDLLKGDNKGAFPARSEGLNNDSKRARPPAAHVSGRGCGTEHCLLGSSGPPVRSSLFPASSWSKPPPSLVWTRRSLPPPTRPPSPHLPQG